MSFTVFSDNVYNRIEMAIANAVSLMGSKFSTYDAVDCAMDQFGLNYEAESEEIFDLICMMI